MEQQAKILHLRYNLQGCPIDGPLDGPRKRQLKTRTKVLGMLMTMAIETENLPAASKSQLRTQLTSWARVAPTRVEWGLPSEAFSSSPDQT